MRYLMCNGISISMNNESIHRVMWYIMCNRNISINNESIHRVMRYLMCNRISIQFGASDSSDQRVLGIGMFDWGIEVFELNELIRIADGDANAKGNTQHTTIHNTTQLKTIQHKLNTTKSLLSHHILYLFFFLFFSFSSFSFFIRLLRELFSHSSLSVWQTKWLRKISLSLSLSLSLSQNNQESKARRTVVSRSRSDSSSSSSSSSAMAVERKHVSEELIRIWKTSSSSQKLHVQLPPARFIYELFWTVVSAFLLLFLPFPLFCCRYFFSLFVFSVWRQDDGSF